MLPDLRIVIVAVISTFVLTVGAGFYTSSRLILDTKSRGDLRAAMEETPVNRIALSWPEPMRQSEPLALDFAVTTRALRNPVRDITAEVAAAEQQAQPVRMTASEPAVPAPVETPTQARAPVPVDVPLPTAAPSRPQQEPATVLAAPPPTASETPPPAASEKPAPVPEPDIRVAVQYPPVVEFPQELQAPKTPVEKAAVEETAQPAPLVQVTSEEPASTGSIAEPAKDIEADRPEAARTENAPADSEIATLPDVAGTEIAQAYVLKRVPLPKPAPKIRGKRAAGKKVAPARKAKRQVRSVQPVAATITRNFPFTLTRRN